MLLGGEVCHAHACLPPVLHPHAPPPADATAKSISGASGPTSGTSAYAEGLYHTYASVTWFQSWLDRPA